MTTHKLNTGPARYQGESDTVTTSFRMPTHPARDRANGTHSFCWIEPGKQYIGRTATEPYLASFQDATVITRWDRSAELAAAEADRITLADGDKVEVNGYTFTVAIPTNRWDEIKFTLD